MEEDVVFAEATVKKHASTEAGRSALQRGSFIRELQEFMEPGSIVDEMDSLFGNSVMSCDAALGGTFHPSIYR